MVTTDQICRWVEAIEREKIPAPVWVPGKQVFEYEEVTAETVAFLKLVRAAESLHALQILAEQGLIYDFGAVMRVIIECLDDALFLVEGNPETNSKVDKFVAHFAKTTLDNATDSTYLPVKREKIQNAATRVIPALASGVIGGFGEIEKLMKSLRERIWNAWCGSVHSNYAEIMQMYGPRGPRARFQFQGLPREHVQSWVWEHIEVIRNRTAWTLWAVAMKFGLGGLADEIAQEITL